MRDPSRRPTGPTPHGVGPDAPPGVPRPHPVDATDQFSAAAPEPYADPTMPPPTPMALARLAVVLFTAALTGGIVVSAIFAQLAFAVVVLAMQLLFVVAYVWLRRPPGPMVAIVTGLVTAVAADAVALYSQPFSLNKLVFVLVGGFGLAIVGQLLRRGGREQLTVSMGAAMFVTVVACGFATWIGLLRQPGGLQALEISAIAVGAGVLAARACDLTLPKPRINRQVPRGAFGIVIGGMFGTAGAAYAAVMVDGPEPTKAALAGLVIGLVGVLADLAAGYTQAGRRIAGKGVALWPVRHGLGPLLAFGAAAPVAYLLSVYFIVRGF